MSVIIIEDDGLTTHPSDTLSIVDPDRFIDQPQLFDNINTPPSSSPTPTLYNSQEDSQILGLIPTPISIPTILNIEGPQAETYSTALNARRRYSWIWKHMPDTDSNTIYLDNRGKVQWRCHYCKQKYLESDGTRIIAVHLRIYHSISEASPREERRERVQATIQQAIQNASKSAGFKRRRMIKDEETLENLPDEYVLDPYVLELLFVRLFARCSLPVKLIECDEFRAILYYLNKQTAIWVPDSQKTLTS
ncbi:uncharacterized protein EAE98_010919 [Botrytis deweyae]|uniref:BED-type domain-containing protein n=1 Tax=Botrytis deweyae TaxID=2478750 RepID=A0ABQ7I787_9HELO|nr:uncharacterized protein EAE98_010919 [Botrytis deweyae]KAF7915839.1 hypothetical protein EAE98_010919 [Botrytis deweyae]